MSRQKRDLRLIKVNVVFLGYVRQINQIDATFKQMFLNMADFGPKQMAETVQSIETTVEHTLQKVKIYMLEGEATSKE